LVHSLRTLTPLILGIAALVTCIVCVFAIYGLGEVLKNLYLLAMQTLAAMQLAYLSRWLARRLTRRRHRDRLPHGQHNQAS